MEEQENWIDRIHKEQMVIFLDGGNVTWTSYTSIDHVQ